MKRFVIAVFSVLFLLIAAMLIVPSFIDWNAYKAQAVEQVKTHTGLDLSIGGNVSFSVLPSPRFSAQDVSILAPEKGQYENVIRFDRLDVVVSLMPLLNGNIDITSLSISKPDISLEMMENGKLNIMTDTIEALMVQKEGDVKPQNLTVMPNISLSDIRIKDATFSYFDQKTKQETKIENVNADISAQSIYGPYSAKGSLFVMGKAVDFDIDADKFDAENNILSPKAKILIKPDQVAVQYNGVLTLDDNPSVQGQAAFRIENLSALLSAYDIQSVSNDITVIEAKGLLTADAKKLDFNNFEIISGADTASGSLNLVFDPMSYNLGIKSGKTFNISKLAGGIFASKTGSFDVNLAAKGDKTTIGKSFVKVGDQRVDLSGSYAQKDRSEIKLKIKSKALNYDSLMAAQSSGTSASAGGDMKDSIRALSLPFDLDVTAAIDRLIIQKQSLNSVNLSANFKKNKVNVKSASLKNFAGADIKLSGDITDIRTTSGIHANVEVKVANVQKFAQYLQVDTSGFPANLKKANIKAKLSGSLNVIDMTTNISALKGTVIAKGKLKNPMSNPELDGITLQVKHGNMGEAVKILTGATINDPNLRKNLDLYMVVQQDGQKYSLSDVKGDLSGVSIQGDLKVDLGKSIPNIQGDLKFGKMNLMSVMTGSSGSSSKAPKGERWSKEPINTSVLHAVNADISLTAQAIRYGVWPLKNPTLKMNLKNGNLKISKLEAGLFGGKLSMTSDIQTVAKSRQPIHFEGTNTFVNVDVSKLTKALVGSNLVKLSGTGTLDMNVKSSGASPAALIYDLSGSGTIKGNDVLLDGVDVTRFVRALSVDSKPGDTVMGLWKGATKGGQTAFETLDGSFTIKEGVVTLEKMDLEGSTAAIKTHGTVNLPNWTLSTKHSMSVKGDGDIPSDVPPFEVSVSGSLDNPAQDMAQGVLNDYLNQKIQRKLGDLLSKKLGGSLGEKLGIPKVNDTPQAKPASNSEASAATPHSENQGSNSGVDWGNSEDASNDNNPEPEPDFPEGGTPADLAEEAIKGVLEGLLR